MTNMVRAKLEFKTFRGFLAGRCHDAGVVDQDVDVVNELADGANCIPD